MLSVYETRALSCSCKASFLSVHLVGANLVFRLQHGLWKFLKNFRTALIRNVSLGLLLPIQNFLSQSEKYLALSRQPVDFWQEVSTEK